MNYSYIVLLTYWHLTLDQIVTCWLLEVDMPRKRGKNGKKIKSNENKTCEMLVHMKNISINSLSDK